MSELTNRLDAIATREQEATPGPWNADTGTRGDCVVWGPNGRFLMNMQAEPHWLEYPDEKRSVSFDVDRRDAEFIAAARTDVPFLLGLVREQAAKLAKVEDLIEWLDAAAADDEPLYAKGKVSARATAKMLRDALGGKA